MPRARLRLTVPAELWVGAVSRHHPDAELRVLTAFADDDSGVALVELHADDPAPVLADIADDDAVLTVEPLHRIEHRTLVEIETSTPVLLYPIRNAGVPLEFPFTIVDGEADWTVTAPADRLSTLADQLREFDIEFTVDHVRSTTDPDPLLAAGQRDLLEAALEAGYYDTPRECTLTELAEEVGMAKSTVSETLHRVEEEIIKSFAAEETDVDFADSDA
jgi:hypothetical protein